jgi:hypothetical protein
MSLVLQSSGGGSVTIAEPTTASNFTQTLPAVDGTVITTGNIPAGSVLQVVSALKQDTFTTVSTSLTDVTGLSVSITPISATSKILVTAVISLTNTNTAGFSSFGAILRDSTIIGAGTPAGNRPAGSFFIQSTTNRGPVPFSMTVLDSPATTSATTYKVQIATEGGGGTAAVGRNNDDINNAAYPRLSCSITVMEIAA